MNAKFSLVMVVVLLALQLGGCIMLRSGTNEHILTWPLQAQGERKSIDIILSGKTSSDGKEQDVPPQFIEKWRAQAAKAYSDSGNFSRVTTGSGDSDLRAEISVLDRGEGSQVLAFISGFTMGIIPATGSDEMIFRTTFKDREGKSLGTFEKSEKLTLWIQLFLVFAMPFNSPGAVSEQVLYDINRATILEARGKSVF